MSNDDRPSKKMCTHPRKWRDVAQLMSGATLEWCGRCGALRIEKDRDRVTTRRAFAAWVLPWLTLIGLFVFGCAMPVARGRDLCDAAIARNTELLCIPGGPGVEACIPQWDGREQCDSGRVAACFDRVDASNDCESLRIAWRSCLSACTPTAP